MNRQERNKRARDVRSAISTMRHELKTASGKRKAELTQDISYAMDDYTSFLDDEMWEGEGETYPVMDENPFRSPFEEPFEETPSFEEADPFLEESEFTGFESDLDSGFDSGLDSGFDSGLDSGFDSVEYYMSESKPSNMEVPLGSLEQNTNQYASVEKENRQHVSYILDKVAEVVSAIEKYEERQASTNKPVKSAGARKHIANHMKRLASVVQRSDFKQASTGKHLDNVGMHIVTMHNKLVKG